MPIQKPKPASSVNKKKMTMSSKNQKQSYKLPPSGAAANNRSTRGLDYTGPIAQQRTAGIENKMLNTKLANKKKPGRAMGKPMPKPAKRGQVKKAMPRGK